MLPKELVALIHHIELNKAGWWDRAVQQLIMFVLWLENNKPLTLETILSLLAKELTITLDRDQCERNLKLMTKDKKIIRIGDTFKLSESLFKEISDRVKEAERLEQEVKNIFISLAQKLCPTVDALNLWSDFNNSFLAPFIREMGAHVFDFVVGETQTERVERFAKRYFDEFKAKYPLDIERKLQELIHQFLNFKNEFVRSYILRMMNSYFYVEACGVKQEILEKLMRYIKIKPSFYIFVDTNFLFSILNLHDNPSNEAAAKLMELIKQLFGKITIKLYVTSLTLDEAKRVLSNAKSSLQDIRVTPKLAESATIVEMSGIERKFFEACIQNPALNAESFFAPYVNNLLQLLRAKGVELYNEKLDEYKTNQKVIDDILAQQEFEKNRFGDRAKSYEALEHDMVLWHFVKGKRQAYVESPIEAKYWIVTVDYRLLGFDAYKTRGDQIPVCIHPATLAQMLQFWVPRTDTLEEVLFASLRLPLFFSEFDPETERATLAILRTLSRYENIEDLSLETIIHLLLNESLRARIQTAEQVEERVQLVKEALIEEHARLKKELDASVIKLREREKELEQMEKTIHKLEKDLEGERKSKESLQARLQQAEQQIQKLQEAQKEEEKRRTFRKFVQWSIIALGASIGVAYGVVLLILNFLTLIDVELRHPMKLVIIVESGMLIFWPWILDCMARKIVIRHPFIEAICKFKRWIRGFLSMIIVSVLASLLLDALKNL